MLKEAYERGYQHALEKLSFRFGSALGTAGAGVGKSTSGVRFTRSMCDSKGLSTKGSITRCLMVVSIQARGIQAKAFRCFI